MEQLIENFKPVKFFPYTSIVTNLIHNENYRIGETSEAYETAEIVWHHFATKAAEIGYVRDNKTVIQIEDSDGNTLYIGNCDHRISVGFGVMENL